MRKYFCILLILLSIIFIKVDAVKALEIAGPLFPQSGITIPEGYNYYVFYADSAAGYRCLVMAKNKDEMYIDTNMTDLRGKTPEIEKYTYFNGTVWSAWNDGGTGYNSVICGNSVIYDIYPPGQILEANFDIYDSLGNKIYNYLGDDAGYQIIEPIDGKTYMAYPDIDAEVQIIQQEIGICMCMLIMVDSGIEYILKQ